MEGSRAIAAAEEARAEREAAAAKAKGAQRAAAGDGDASAAAVVDTSGGKAARKALAAQLEAAPPPRSARPRSASPARTPRTPREVVSAVFDAETNAALAELRRLGRS